MSRSKGPSPRSQAAPAARTPAQLLEELLPRAQPVAAEAHLNVALLEVADPVQLLELASDTALQSFLLCRLAPNVALVDLLRADGLADLLRRRGHTPKIIKPAGGP